MRLDEIVARLGGELRGDGLAEIVQVAPLERAGCNEIGFVAQAKYAGDLAATRAGAVILPAALADAWQGNAILAADPYLYFAQVAQLLNLTPQVTAGVHASAVVLSEVPPSASIAPLAFVGEGCVIGEGVIIGPGCVVEAGVVIGAHSWLRANVTVYRNCVIGSRCTLHAGAVLGSDGFGYARRKGGSWEKIPQIGRAILGDDVEIGANTTLDRGALDDTVIANGVKLDNLIHIAHNCNIGESTAMAAQVGISGSTKIGKRVLIGGQAGFNGHIEIGDDVVISGGTSVTKSLLEKGVYTAMFPAEPHKEWMRSAARFRRFDETLKRLRELEKRLEELEKTK